MPLAPETETLLSVRELADALGKPRNYVTRRCQAGAYPGASWTAINGHEGWAIPVTGLRPEERALLDHTSGAAPAGDVSDADVDAILYSKAPEYQRRQYDKYTAILRECAGLRGKELRGWAEVWNRHNPKLKTSYCRIIDARKTLDERGPAGLLGGWGNRAGDSIVADELFEKFKSYYLVQGAPSPKQCWLRTLGYTSRTNPDGSETSTAKDFPSMSAFLRRVEREVPEGHVYLARYGRDAWNRSKYAVHINRDYGEIRAGQVWVADHAQVDVLVQLPKDPQGRPGKIVAPWVTAWTDVKTSKWLGWILRPEPPSSDPIFGSFRRAALVYGLCETVLLDNGKDFRCRDFAGGRPRYRLQLDEAKTVSTLSLLGITARFARPYNAQSKPIERLFLKNKGMFSAFMPGYRGGDVVERPAERLKGEIRKGDILPFAEFKTLFDRFVVECVNKCPSTGKSLQGRSPDEAWAQEFTVKKEVSKEALRLFCCRTGRDTSIGANGVNDPELGCRYWGEWMSGQIGRRVYLRRDIDDYAEATVWDAATQEWLGDARTKVFDAAFFAHTPVQVEQYKNAIAAKKRHERIARDYAASTMPGADEGLADLQAGIMAIAGKDGMASETTSVEATEVNPKVHVIPDTLMDGVVRERARQANEGADNIPGMTGEFAPRKRYADFECDLQGTGT